MKMKSSKILGFLWMVVICLLIRVKAEDIFDGDDNDNDADNEPDNDFDLNFDDVDGQLINVITTTSRTATKTNPKRRDNTATASSSQEFHVAKEAYCRPQLCELFDGRRTHLVPHIACRNDDKFGRECGVQPLLLKFGESRRNLILNLHNLVRARIAAGKLPGYKTASRMPILKWDKELEYLASLHAKRCKFEHDLCRNTERFQFSGQNIALFWIQRDIKAYSGVLKHFIIRWFLEHMDANQTFIDHYHDHPEGKKIGHFTLMVSDQVHRIGCAAVRFHRPHQMPNTNFLLTCNYDFSNLFGEPIYRSGPPASKCPYRRSDKYPTLCDWKDSE